jgi:ribonuclease R
MKNAKIEEAITAIFRANGNNPLSFNELSYQLNLVKKTKPLYSETLNEMVAEGTVAKKSRKFRLARPEKLAEEQPSPTSSSLSPKLVTGIFDATPLSRNYSYAFVRTPEGDFFVSSEDTLNAYHNDEVAIEPHYRRGVSDYARIRRIVRRANETLAGEIHRSQNRWIFICSNPKIHNWFEVSDIAGANENEKVILKVTNWGNPLSGKLPAGVITEVLGPSGDPQVELLAVIRQYQLPLEFPQEVMDEVALLPDRLDSSVYGSRSDFRYTFTFTIDPSSAKDFDDAISLETTDKGWKLYVHIADVAHYVKPGSAAFTEAAKRGNSFYFPKKVIPMLPERISNKICSLRPQEEKLTLSVVTEFNSKGKVLRQYMCESVIRSDFRLSYEEVDDLFENRPNSLDPELAAVLNSARKLSSLLSQKRLAAGYIFFDLPEIEYEYDDQGFIRHLSLAEETESHKLIENFMLVANEYVAQELTRLSPTTLYRVHEDPDSRKTQKLTDLLSHYGISFYERETLNFAYQYLLHSLPTDEYHRVFDRIILRSMKKAKYTTQHLRHFGLGMETYTHFTSPIRRLCDLLVHHLCKTYVIRSSKLKFSSVHLRKYAETANEQELQADQAERDIQRVYSLHFMKGHIGEKYSGVVLSANSSSLIVALDQIPVTGILKVDTLPGGNWQYRDRELRFVNGRTGEYYQLTDKVLVEIVEVSDDIYFKLQQVANAHTHLDIPGRKTDNVISGRKMPGRKPQGRRNAVDARPASKKSGFSNRKHKKRK